MGNELITKHWGSDYPDMVSHPPHYQSETGLEVIDVIEAFTFDLKGIEATDTGNIIKYICRRIFDFFHFYEKSFSAIFNEIFAVFGGFAVISYLKSFYKVENFVYFVNKVNHSSHLPFSYALRSWGSSLFYVCHLICRKHHKSKSCI